MSLILAAFARRQVKSTTETSVVGTRKAMPVSFPLSSGITLPTALAAPVEEGIMLAPAALPALQSFPPLEGPSTVSWFMVTAWTVVMRPSSIPHLSLRTLVMGARQLVVQEALETTVMSLLYPSWLTPTTKIGQASFGGAERTTFLAPPLMWRSPFS